MNSLNPNKFVNFSGGGQAIERGNDFERWFRPPEVITDYNYYGAIEAISDGTVTALHISKNVPDNKVSYSLTDAETLLLSEGQYYLEIKRERISDSFAEELWWSYANVYPVVI